jgi:release factor glutamine methyltransferase
VAALVGRRVAGEPLEHLLGWVEFAGLRLRVEPGVFVPRARTAWLVEQALVALRGAPGPEPVVVDLCCGTGAVGAAVRAAEPGVRVHAADIDPTAVRCARRNLPGAEVHEGDLFEALPAHLQGRIDVLVVNAPYVPTHAIALMPPEARDHEPRAALDGGADGLDLLRRVVHAAPGWLAPGGTLLVESGVGQSPVLAGAVRQAGLSATVVHDDERGGTVVVAR